MAYSKPKTLAKSVKKSSYVAGCPEKGRQNSSACKDCERSG